MEIKTKYFGEIEINKEEIITFEEGIPGFEEYTKYVIFSQGEDYYPFLWMQSIEEPYVAFIIIDPKIPVPDYYVDVNDSEIESLKISDLNNVSIFTIVVISNNDTKITTNLKAPLIINKSNNKGKQVIINNDYDIRHIIYKQNAVVKSGG